MVVGKFKHYVNLVVSELSACLIFIRGDTFRISIITVRS